ncbi:MAG: endonuclease/exonuclease/phosphatase family protein [Akkermansiaceae bacterium]
MGIQITPANKICVVSYNIRHGVNMQNELNLNGTINAIQSLTPDIIALQEVDQLCDRSNKVDQPAHIAEKLGMDHAFGKAMDLQGGNYGQAILSKYPILKSKVHRLPGEGEPRIALEIIIEPAKGQKISCISVHLNFHSEETRQLQIKSLQQALKSVTHPIILMGDFNAQPESNTIKMLKQQWRNIPKKGAQLTFPADTPTIEIDYFWLRNWKAEGVVCEVVTENNTSDHRPLQLMIHLPEANEHVHLDP